VIEVLCGGLVITSRRSRCGEEEEDEEEEEELSCRAGATCVYLVLRKSFGLGHGAPAGYRPIDAPERSDNLMNSISPKHQRGVLFDPSLHIKHRCHAT
jgi:hypothetical protein